MYSEARAALGRREATRAHTTACEGARIRKRNPKSAKAGLTLLSLFLSPLLSPLPASPPRTDPFSSFSRRMSDFSIRLSCCLARSWSCPRPENDNRTEMSRPGSEDRCERRSGRRTARRVGSDPTACEPREAVQDSVCSEPQGESPCIKTEEASRVPPIRRADCQVIYALPVFPPAASP